MVLNHDVRFVVGGNTTLQLIFDTNNFEPILVPSIYLVAMCPYTFSNPLIKTQKSNTNDSLPSKHLPILQCLDASALSTTKFRWMFLVKVKKLKNHSYSS